MLSRSNQRVCARHAGQFGKRLGNLGLEIRLSFSAKLTRRNHAAIWSDAVSSNRAIEISCPALDSARFRVDPVEPRLPVFVLSFDRAVLHFEKNMLAVFGPAQILLLRLIVRDLSRRTIDSRVRQLDRINLELADLFLALRNRLRCKCQRTPVWRNIQFMDTPWRSRQRASTWSRIRFILRISLR